MAQAQLKQQLSEHEPINYSPEPTIEDFHQSNAIVKGLRGPEGSAKTVGCFFDIFKYACRQEPYKDRRSTHWTVVRSCYDDQTEILTRDRGFQLFKNVTKKDYVATLQNNSIVYERPDGISISDYNGEMIGFENEGADFLVTPDHEMWVSRKHTRKQIFDEYHMEYAEDVYKRGKTFPCYRVKRDALWNSKQKISVKMSGDFFEWLGFWFAEGSISKKKGKDGYERRRTCITQTLTDGIEYTRTLFDRAEIPFYESKRKDGGINFLVPVRKPDIPCRENEIFEILEGCGKAIDKSVPLWMKNATPHQIKAFINGFIAGDGYIGKSTVAFTSSKQLADDLQEMAMKAGMVANVNKRDRRGKRVEINGNKGKINSIEYTVTFVGKHKYRPYLYADQKVKSRRKGWYKKQYNGKVYCAEMTTSTVYVRRNGKAFWCNRTYPELLTTSLRTFEQWFGSRCKRISRQPPIEAEYRMKLPDNTRVEMNMLFLALDVPDDVKKLKSLETTGGFLNEASEMGRWILTRLLGRCGRWPPKRWGVKPVWSGVLMDTNSCEDDHWWYKAAEEDKPDGWKFFDQPSALIRFQADKQISAYEKANQYVADNQHLPNDFLRIVEDMFGNQYVGNPDCENAKWQPLGINYWLNTISGRPLKEINTLVMNEYGPTGDDVPVYPEYQDHLHCSKEILTPMKGIGITLGFDFGLMPACTFSQISPRGQKLFIDEMQVEKHGAMGIRQLSREHIVPYLLDNFLPWLIKGLVCGYGDPAGTQRAQTDEKTCYQILRECPTTNPTGGTADFKLNGKRLSDPEYFNKIREQAGKGYVSMGDIGVEVSPATTNKFGIRRDALAKLLIMRIDGDPAFMLSPKCKNLRKGLRGKYRYKRVQVGGSDERYTNIPIKDATSHGVESAMYSCLMSSYFAYDSTEEAEHVKQAKLDALDTPSRSASMEYAAIVDKISQEQEAMGVWF